jgi:hypothetical protein
MDQCIFDEIMHFVLQTISSSTYLNDIDIYRPEMMNRPKFKSKLEKQVLDPGVYPVNYGGVNSVHYFGVSERNNKIIAANGYPSRETLPPKFSVALNAQPNHSHGLCQTFALMYYKEAESLLIQGDYFKNVVIGLEFLLDFIQDDYDERERLWTMSDLLTGGMEKQCYIITDNERKEVLRKCRLKTGRKNVALSLLIKNILLNKKYRSNLRDWYD